MPNFIPPELIARMAKLDPVCDFRLDRRERSQAENAGRAFRFWRVEIALRGCLDRRWEQTVPLTAAPAPPHIIVEGGRLADTLARAVELAEEVKWDAAWLQLTRER
jgi:hypothetical protein